MHDIVVLDHIFYSTLHTYGFWSRKLNEEDKKAGKPLAGAEEMKARVALVNMTVAHAM